MVAFEVRSDVLMPIMCTKMQSAIMAHQTVSSILLRVLLHIIANLVWWSLLGFLFQILSLNMPNQKVILGFSTLYMYRHVQLITSCA